MKPFNAQRAPVYAKNGMACSSQPLAATIGHEILRAGGNAADAAVAMAAMVNVTEPMMNGLGGDSFMLVHWEGKFFGLNASGRSGSGFTLDALRAAGLTVMPKASGFTVTVPGALGGYLALHERFGSMDLSALVEPAARAATEGFAVGAKISRAWEWGASKLQRFSPEPDVYLPGGMAPVAGQIFAQPDLAATWRKVGRDGRSAFYAGELRDRILEVLASTGGTLDATDFDAVQAQWVAPVSTTYRGFEVLELPPNGQGLVVLMALRMLEAFDLKQLFETDPVAATHLILEAIKLGFADASRFVADPDFGPVPVERLLSSEYLAVRRALIDPHHAIANLTRGASTATRPTSPLWTRTATPSPSSRASRTSSAPASSCPEPVSSCTIEERILKWRTATRTPPPQANGSATRSSPP
jgi:gamma-glutamyltranspeptidase / glutathione hydrolase